MPRAAMVMTTFAVGAATPILVLGYGSRRAIFTRRQHLSLVSSIAKPATGIAMAALGIFALTGVDKTVETVLTNAMPYWLVSVTTRL
jgi:hypothetical protein